MKTYKWNYRVCVGEGDLDVPSAMLSTTRWARRRSFPIRIVSVTPHLVSVELDAPTTYHHNRAVNALGKILDRQYLRRRERSMGHYITNFV